MPRATFPSVALLALLLALIAFLYIPSLARSFVDWNGWALAELHVSYAAGPVRRGLLGEIALHLAALGIVTRDFFATLFALLTIVQAALLAVLAGPLARTRPPLFLAILLSPALLLFAAYDADAYMRKEILISLGILAHALIARRALAGGMTTSRYEALVMWLLAPALLVVCAIHEIQLLFVPLHMALVVLVARSSQTALRRFPVRPLAVLASVAGAALAFVIAFRGTPDMAQRICASWQGIAPIDCTAIAALGFDFLPALTGDGLPTATALARFVMAMLLALLPAAAIALAAKADGHRHVPPALLALALLPPLLLFHLGWDWGRWIHLIALSAVALQLTTPQTAKAPARIAPLATAILWIAAITYVVSWKLRHCCELASTDGGLFPTLARAIEIVAGAR